MMPDLNGATSAENLFIKQVLVASGTATYAGVDLTNYIGICKVVFSSLTVITDGSTTITASLLDSADNTTFTALTAPTFAPVTGTASFQSVPLDTRVCRRYVQGKHVVTGTTATFTAAMILIGEKQVV